MANGKCKRRAVSFGKWVGRTLGPAVLQHIAVVAGAIDGAGPGWLTNHQRREIVIEAAKGEYRKAKNITAETVLGGEVERAIRAALENALHALRDKQNPATPGEISESGPDDVPDLVNP